MLREKFAEIIAEALTAGYSRGIDVFMENLEYDLAKKEVLSEVGLEEAVVNLMENDGYEVIED